MLSNSTVTYQQSLFSLHDALPIFPILSRGVPGNEGAAARQNRQHLLVARVGGNAQPAALHHFESRGHRIYPRLGTRRDRKSTRLNSSHVAISYAVLCL